MIPHARSPEWKFRTEVPVRAIVHFNEEELVHMTLMEFVEQLKVDPKKLLGKCVLVIAGGSTSGRVLVYLSKHAYYAEQAQKFTIQLTGTPNDALPFETFNIRMIPNSEPLNLAAIPINEKGACHLTASGPGFMTTGQLTGCAFAILKTGAEVRCAHVQPDGQRHLDGAALKKELEKNGHFRGAGDVKFTKVFGRGDYDKRAYVIGIRRNGKWEIYGQHVSGNFGNELQVQKVTQIL